MSPQRRAPLAVLAVLTVLVGAAAASDQPWTLDRCLEAARATSSQLRSTRAEADAAAARRDASGSRLYPVIGLGGRAGHTTEFMSLDAPAFPGGAVTFGDGWDLDLSLGVKVPLYHGGSLRAEREARESLWQASLARVAADSLDLGLRVHRAFYGALGAEAAAAAARQGEDRLQRHLAEIEANLEAGTATEEARVQTLARLRRTQQATLQAEAEAAAQRLGLGRLVGQVGQEIAPTADLTVSLLDGDEDARPWDERPELLALDARREATEHASHAAGASLRPTVDLEGGWHYGRPGVDPVTNKWMDYGTVVLRVSWPLFDFGATGEQVGGLVAESRALAAARADTDEALRTRLATARTREQAVREEQDRARDRVQLEERRLGLVHGRYRAGHATESELLDAQDDVTLATMDLAMARARLRVAEAELLAALGW